MKQEMMKQRRKVRKAAYIDIKGIVRKLEPTSDVEFFVLEDTRPSSSEQEPREVTFFFLHTTKRLAIRGYLSTKEYLWKNSLLARAEAEVGPKHPIPDSAISAIYGSEIRTEYGFEYDCTVEAQWADAFQERELEINARLRELEAQPCTLPTKPVIGIDGCRIFAAAALGFVDAPGITMRDIATFIEQFRSVGEPLTLGKMEIASMPTPMAAEEN